MSRISKTIVWLLATGTCLAVVAAPAQAQRDRVIGGQATFTPSATITSFLLSRGITVTPIGPATVGSGSMTMPTVKGELQMPTMRGWMLTRGGLQYTNGTKALRVHAYRLRHTRHGTRLTAVVNGRRILIARMVGTTVSTSGKTGTMTGGLKLSGVWARHINRLVGKHVVQAGEDLGELTATVTMA
jgi:hypothetical protein